MSDASAETPGWALFVLPFGFALFWNFALQLTSSMSGWRTLARDYASAASITGQTFSFRSGRLGYMNYGTCLQFVSGPAGLAISVLFIFRPGHEPLFVPWSDVSARYYPGWVFRYAELRFERHPELRLRIFRGLAEQLLAAGGNLVRPSEPA